MELALLSAHFPTTRQRHVVGAELGPATKQTFINQYHIPYSINIHKLLNTCAQLLVTKYKVLSIADSEFRNSDQNRNDEQPINLNFNIPEQRTRFATRAHRRVEDMATD